MLVSALGVFSGCAASHQYLKPQDTKRLYSLSYDQVFEKIPTAVKDAHMVLIEVRKSDGVVDVVAPPSFWTSSLGNLMQGGDKVTLVIHSVSPEQTSIEITSQSRGDLIDFGRSARVVGTLFGSLDKNLK